MGTCSCSRRLRCIESYLSDLSWSCGAFSGIKTTLIDRDAFIESVCGCVLEMV